jgi:hypothetical protein
LNIDDLSNCYGFDVDFEAPYVVGASGVFLGSLKSSLETGLLAKSLLNLLSKYDERAHWTRMNSEKVYGV